MSVQVIDFYADWCGPCKKQDPIVQDVKEEWEDNDEVEVKKIDIDNKQDMASQYKVRSIPTVLILVEDDEGTTVFERFVGVTGEDDINDAVSDALNK